MGAGDPDRDRGAENQRRNDRQEVDQNSTKSLHMSIVSSIGAAVVGLSVNEPTAFRDRIRGVRDAGRV